MMALVYTFCSCCGTPVSFNTTQKPFESNNVVLFWYFNGVNWFIRIRTDKCNRTQVFLSIFSFQWKFPFPSCIWMYHERPPLMSCPWCWKPEAPVCLLLFSLVNSDVPCRALSSDHVKILLLFCISGTRARPNVKFAGRLAGGEGRRVNVTENVTLPHCRRSCVSDSWRRLSSIFLACGGRLAHCYHSNTTETEHCVARCKCFQVTWEKEISAILLTKNIKRRCLHWGRKTRCVTACKTIFKNFFTLALILDIYSLYLWPTRVCFLFIHFNFNITRIYLC